MAGKTIQIFLPDGNPKGVKKASITTDIYSHFLHTSDVKAGNILDKIFE